MLQLILTSYVLCLLPLCAIRAAQPALRTAKTDRLLLSALQTSVSNLHHVQVLKRVAVHPELDLIVALGTAEVRLAADRSSGWWNAKSSLGIFLQNRAKPSTIYNVALSIGKDDCEVRVERATASDVVVSCTPEKFGPGLNSRFVYDMRLKSLLKRVDYAPFALKHIFASGDGAVLVGSDGRQPVVLEYNPTDRSPFQQLKGAAAQQWTNRIEPKRFDSLHFGPDKEFSVREEDLTNDNPPVKRLVVVEKVGSSMKRYPLPQSNFKEFARFLPAKVQNGLNSQTTTIDEAIGPWQVEHDNLWFARTFYDGEGNTGVGGFGYFDTAAAKYRIYSPKEILAWSTTAMLVIPDAVWLAVAHRGEYGTDGYGILRFDRTTQKIERTELDDVVNEIAYVGGRLLLATDFGAAVIENHTVHRFFVDPTLDGQLQVTESVPAQK